MDSIWFQQIIMDNINVQIDTNQIFKKHSFCTLKESIEHNIENIILLNYVNKKCKKYLEIIEESILGTQYV